MLWGSVRRAYALLDAPAAAGEQPPRASNRLERAAAVSGQFL